MNPPRLHSTPEDAVADRVQEKVIVEGRTFLIERPAGLDKVFDHPAVRSAYAADEYIPYWTDLWASSRMLSKFLLREKGKLPRDVLEIGCGLGLAGITALSLGCHVTFSDIDETACQFAAINARLNGLHNFRTLPLDVRSPPDELRFPLILGTDLMYEERLVEPLARFLKQVLTADGIALIADPDRIASKSFKYRAYEAGLRVETRFVRAGQPGGERTKGTLYRLSHVDLR